MRLTDGMTLYHGSYLPVEHIDLGRCSHGKDFGRGFYVTSDLEQAKRFIPNSIRKAKRERQVDGMQSFGYVSTFVFHGNPEDFHHYDFPEANDYWLKFVVSNRGRDFDAEEIHFIKEERLASAEIISGKVANDNTNMVIDIYLGGGYGPLNDPMSIATALRLLRPEYLKDQFCFLTQHAVDSLTFQEVTRYGSDKD